MSPPVKPYGITAAQDARWEGDLVAIDPGLNSPGVSVYRFGELSACTRLRISEEISSIEHFGQRCMRVACELFHFVQSLPNAPHRVVRTVVYEKPQIYNHNGGKSKGNPNQLLGLVAIGQSFATLCYVHNLSFGVRVPELLTPKPDEWTGQLKKYTTGSYWASPRGKRVKEALTADELQITPDQHDAGDSVGIGAWGLGRYNNPATRRVFSGATRK